MINLTTIKQITKSYISNPIKNVFARLHSPSALERTPLKDTVNFSRENILGANPIETIKQIIAKNVPSKGKDAAVFPIPNQENYVLRIEQNMLDKIPKLSSDVKLIPIQHKSSISANENLGLPLFSVVDKSSSLYAKTHITPQEALAQKGNITILRKVTGKHPAKETFNALMEFIGASDKQPDVRKYINFKQLMDIRQKYGTKGLQKCMGMLGKQANITIPANFFEDGSIVYNFSNTQQLLKDYKTFVATYKKELKEIASMPKEAYKEAVDTIVADKNFLVDFQHTNNTFVDVKNKKFCFMDFEYDKTNAKYIYDNPVREFRNVLLGKCFCNELKSPTLLICNEGDIKVCKSLIEKISKNVDGVAPEEYKFLK